MSFLISAATIFLGYVIYRVSSFWRIRSRLHENGIPSAGAYPIVGNTGESLLQTASFYDILEKNYKFCPEAKYVIFFNFMQPAFVLRDLDLIKSIGIKNVESFTDHNVYVIKKLDLLFANGIFNLKGQKWHDVRNLLSPAFTGHKMRLMFHMISECAENFSGCISTMALGGGKEFEMKDVFTKYANDVIAKCAFGIEIDSMRNPSNEFYVLGRKATNFEGLLSLKMMLSAQVPWLMRLFKIKLYDDHLTNFFKDTIESTIKTRDERGITRPDFLQLMMEARGKSNELNLMEMTSQAFAFFSGGFETTTTLMSSLAHEIAVNPEIQRKLQDEIDAVWKETKGNLTYDAVNGMPYLDAVINEGLRLYPPAVLTDRVCTKSFELPPSLPGKKSYTLKVGDLVWIPIGPILRDPEYFPNPDKLIPERFLGKKIAANQPPYIPFGLGTRMCIGNRFALLKVKIVLVHLLFRCNLKACPRTKIPVEFSKQSFTLSSKHGYWLRIEPRVSSSV